MCVLAGTISVADRAAGTAAALLRCSRLPGPWRIPRPGSTHPRRVPCLCPSPRCARSICSLVVTGASRSIGRFGASVPVVRPDAGGSLAGKLISTDWSTFGCLPFRFLPMRPPARWKKKKSGATGGGAPLLLSAGDEGVRPAWTDRGEARPGCLNNGTDGSRFLACQRCSGEIMFPGCSQTSTGPATLLPRFRSWGCDHRLLGMTGEVPPEALVRVKPRVRRATRPGAPARFLC
jgi:hypothetical protein